MDNHLREVSDGKLYSHNEMVKVGCRDCSGCSACCCDMGQSILLDPMDIYRLEQNLGLGFEQLLAGDVELHVEDRLILPNLKMTETKKGLQCSFLNEEGRCSIHSFRPGICRLFPLGRNYKENTLTYFLLTNACPVKNKSKMKISKWLDTEGLKDYEQFLIKWHSLTKALRTRLMACEEEEAKQLNMRFLQLFYFTPVKGDDFYRSIYQRFALFDALSVE